MDPSVPNQILLGGDDGLLNVTGGRTGLNTSSQRFLRILHLATTSGEHEKLTQVWQPPWENQGSLTPPRCLPP